MSDASIRVAIVDDQALFASGLSMLIQAQPDIECVGIAADGRQAQYLVESENPDIVLMDLRMPVMNGIEATRLILRERDPDTSPRVIVLTTIKRDEAVYSALHAGAVAFLTKDAPPAEVLGTIRGIHLGQTTPAEIAALGLVQEFGIPTIRAGSSADQLSEREHEVLLCVARGLSNIQIAESIHVSEATVKSHVRSVLGKLDLRSRVQIAIYAYENRLIPIHSDAAPQQEPEISR